VDLFTGALSPVRGGNPKPSDPGLEDGDFRLTESSAILKYLADKIDSPAYPKDLRQRARVNERMDWINTQVCRDFAYGFVYPQIFPTHKRPSDEVAEGHRSPGGRGARRAGSRCWTRTGSAQAHLSVRRQMTIADYFGRRSWRCRDRAQRTCRAIRTSSAGSVA
jgi:glutathione S-transferase